MNFLENGKIKIFLKNNLIFLNVCCIFYNTGVNMKINKSQLFKDAWFLVKTKNFTMSQALKASWLKVKNPSFEEILKIINPIISYYSGYVSSKTYLEKEDVNQLILIKVFKSYKKYDSKFSVKTFFKVVIYNYSKDLIKNTNRKKNKIKTKTRNIEESEMITDYRDLYSKIEINECLKSYIDNFEGKSKEVYECMIRGMSIKDISEKLNTYPAYINNLIKRKIKPILLNSNFKEILI